MDNGKPREGQLCRLVIDGYASDGAGVARLDGMVVFVQGGIRGEACDVRLTHVGRSALWGRVEEVVNPSPARIFPRCLHYTKCGGCQFRHMNYAEELEAKRIRVEDALRRLGGAEIHVSAILGAEQVDRYRNKAQFPVAKGPRIGFYRPRSHDVIDVDDCLLQGEAAARLRGAVKEWMAEYSIPAYNERTFTGLVRHVYVRTNRAGRSLCCLLVNGRGVPREVELVRALRRAEPNLAGIVLGVNEKHNNVILGDSYRTLWGEDFLSDTLCGLTFRLSVPSFYQVNPAQTEVLYGKALEFAGLTGAETVLDLYCGIGTISLVMARKAGMVWGAEVVPQAVDDAIANARRNHIENARFLCADAGEAARYLEGEGVRPDVVCVDPPRKGLAEDVVDTIADMGPERVVYVSCDPGTLGRDVKRFAGRGYTLKKAVAVDMFPRTAHVETVVLLSKGEVDSKKIRVEFSLEDMDMSEFQDGATYTQIKDYVLEHSGLKVSNLYISQIKRKCGIEVGKNYNLPKSEDSRQPMCPPEKEKAIREAFKYFGMI
ncbi:23S rRNA (uracil(1939)-C(5))-methyltransferase RlmD [Flavonifractor plautii]|uniref:23S rRNA (Uracil(1939)-C(5))-methyltransferase RlmD n=1 Tax=Flavonifractor plautii TaxID=292800 RepID=A0A6I2R5H6_FLAPL|nr:23S rRNA (uracil(1939)-C(5))-methyltransferase RlmD [Flavonifractor plautii]EHO35100.1 23S rRNA (uracil-5-)-methyltransferase RumA [Lachnospiraceae bacterium 7_1_58FAA]MCB6873236.1 23S rRNA (uracil(1939)-C(5))-methyltransferase RlmD [Flavonifractor plautii]MDB7910059.1 23S rRNA (uracil(1939)-C(5))-methyltransferase RlmD [Flavonifractor plautii]MDB7913709.1 23S rRNA (uracil(1939)-C(5))-methyltransferase RlmD [Flavonifractor plautii]MDS9669188.1 23S rRNA (uracil(1939)-C(5))-methyltransferase 